MSICAATEIQTGVGRGGGSGRGAVYEYCEGWRVNNVSDVSTCASVSDGEEPRQSPLMSFPDSGFQVCTGAFWVGEEREEGESDGVEVS